MSVIIPTFERRDLVKRAVASVLGQTFRDFELIVVDNGSTDGTREALAAFGDRLRYVVHPVRGAAAARNAGLRVARAPLVAFLDSDNRWLPDHLATLTAALARHPDAVLVSTCPGFRVAGRQPPQEAQLADPWSDPFRFKPGYTSCIAVLREALLAVGGFDERLVVGEDADLWMRLAALGPYCVLQRRTIVKRHTRGGLVDRERGGGGYLVAGEKIARGVIQELERRGVQPNDRPLLEARGRLHLYAAGRAIRRGDEAAAAASLTSACELLPELSRQPIAIIRGLKLIGLSQPRDHLNHVRMTQALWPDPGSDTALGLRAYVAVLELRAGRPREAAKLLRGGLRPTAPGFVARLLRSLSAEALRWLRRNVNRGRESPDLLARPEAVRGRAAQGDPGDDPIVD